MAVRWSPADQAPVDDTALAALQGVCARVDAAEEDCLAAGIDWWPLSAARALGGEVPGRAGVVARPASTAEVSGVIEVCDRWRIPVTASGGRSGVCGGAVPVFGGVALDLTGLAGIAEVDERSLLIEVRAGTFGDDLEAALRDGPGLTLGHWPQSVSLSTVGGWVACRSAGQYSTRYGKIEDMVVGLEVVLADGRVVTTGGRGPRAASGPDLNQLFVGSEGTLGVITAARLRARPAPAHEQRAAYGFATFDQGLDACRRILRRGATPAVLRLYDDAESARSFERPGTHLLLVLDEGDPGLVAAGMDVVAEEAAGAGGHADDVELVARWLGHRNDTSVLATVVRQGVVADTIEIAAAWSALPAIYADAVTGLRAVPGTVAASAHQSHAYGDGACLYFTFAGLPAIGDDGGGGAGGAGGPDRYYRQAWDAVMAATLAHGGAISHHHGIGLNRAGYLREALGPAFDVLVSVKQALDPNGILNPGKLGLPSAFGVTPWP